ncbi:MAG: hypothetical protein JRJ85_25875, partial [Deltaproteobacteria bacterium]|nr:hypothetical protein [Deltaproteobacteria bacterium]
KEGLESQDTSIVNVIGSNQPPTADAGSDQSVVEGATVTLDGAGSSDTDDGIASYLWSQTAGPSITLSDPLAVRPTFFTLSVGESGTEQTFQLTVTDNGGLKKTDEVSVKIEDNGITGFPDGVVTTTSSAGKIIGIKAEDGGNIINFSTVDPDTIEDDENRPIDLIYGLIDMRIRVHTFGGSATVTVYLPDPAPFGYTWCKYSSNRGWADCRDYTVFNDNRTQVTIHLVDGGQGDADGVANGIIIDPSGLGLRVNRAAAYSSDGCFINYVTGP